jgi:hypothetical protein
MNHHYLPIFAIAALLLAGTAQAGTLRCGNAFITDDQPDGQSRQQVLAKCGEPTNRDGDDWYYDRADVGQGTYVLHFNDSGELESIEQQTEE